MDYITTYHGYDYKNRLLMCLLNNLYEKKYAKNKINSKIVFVADTREKLMTEYNFIFKTINNFTPNDLIVLKKFLHHNERNIKKIFIALEKQCISNEEIIKEIQREFTEDRSIHYDGCYDDEKNIDDNVNTIFVRIYSLDEIYDKYMVKDIFTLDVLTYNKMQNGFYGGFIHALSHFIKENIKVQRIVERRLNIECDESAFYTNVYLSGGLDVVDFIDNELRDYSR